MSRTYRKRATSFAQYHQIPRREDAVSPYLVWYFAIYGIHCPGDWQFTICPENVITENMSRFETSMRVEWRTKTDRRYSLCLPKWYRKRTNRQRRCYDKQEIRRTLSFDHEYQCSDWNGKDGQACSYW